MSLTPSRNASSRNATGMRPSALGHLRLVSVDYGTRGWDASVAIEGGHRVGARIDTCFSDDDVMADMGL